MKFPTRRSSSHKGQNGIVCIVGGNKRFYGAPILAALGAEKSGVDLISIMFPEVHREAVERASLNFILHGFQGFHFTKQDILPALTIDPDVFVIGNGLGKNPETHAAILHFLSRVRKPVVIDADALIPEILNIQKKSDWIFTPHAGEFERVFNTRVEKESVDRKAEEYGLTILQKGSIDIIASANGKGVQNKTGVPEMSVGGTGDALAGIVGGFVAQGLHSFEACVSASYIWGKCGELVSKKQSSFSAEDMLHVFPRVLFDEQQK